MGAQTRTDVLPYISLIPVFGYLWPGTSSTMVDYSRSDRCRTSMFEYLICTRVAYRYDARNPIEKFGRTRSLVEISERMVDG